jgi:GNAT superfamily N-acetyltransferase
MSYRTVAISDRPDLASLVARWRVEAFFNYPGGYTAAEMTALILAPLVGPEETFVLFDQDRPVGTAALICTDLDALPNLTSWLADLFVEPAFRGRGHGAALVRRVEAFARAVSLPVLWLYTATAEPFYLRLGWDRVTVEKENGQDLVLMRRSLAPEDRASGLDH